MLVSYRMLIRTFTMRSTTWKASSWKFKRNSIRSVQGSGFRWSFDPFSAWSRLIHRLTVTWLHVLASPILIPRSGPASDFHSTPVTHTGPDMWLVFLQTLTKPCSFLACRWSISSMSVQQWGCGQQCERFCLGLGVGAGEARWERREISRSRVKELGERWDRGKVRKKITTLITPLKAAFLLLFQWPLSSAFFSRSLTPLSWSASFPSVSSQY